MKTTEIREMSASELDSKLAGLKEELFNYLNTDKFVWLSYPRAP